MSSIDGGDLSAGAPRVESALHVVQGQVVDDASNSSVTFDTDLINSNNDFYNNMELIFISGDNIGQIRRISDYVGATGYITVDTAFLDEPSAGESFYIVPRVTMDLATVTAAVGALTDAAAQDGDATTSTLQSLVKGLHDVLWDADGVVAWAAAAAPANGVSIAEVIRYIYSEQFGTEYDGSPDLYDSIVTGQDTSSNPNISANADGSVMERLEYIQDHVAAHTEAQTSYNLPNDTAENTLHEFTITKRTHIHEFAMDFTNLVQSVTVKIYKKIDGTNYKELYGSALAWTTANVDGIDLGGLSAQDDVKITIQSGTAQGAIKAIPYSYWIEEKE